jgi:trimethylamine--corrinoid protein Co-methyltransferase
MRPLQHFHRVLSDGEVERLHESACALLGDPGMRLENRALLEALRRKGASVDLTAEVARFPRGLIEETLEIAAVEERERRKAAAEVRQSGSEASELSYPDQLTFSWHTPFRNRTPPVQASIGGGAPMFYDHERKANRYAGRDDFLATIRLAEGLPEVVTMGNGVHYLKEPDGSDVPPKMVAIKGAALVAKHSSKPGCTSIIDRRQLPFLMELGRIVRGSAEAYLRNPILVNIHDTESPLRLTRPEAAIIEDMTRARLSIFILPMVLAGISSPVYPIAAAITAAAEVLGVWAAVKALRQDCPVEARTVSGVLNPATGAASFATPETVLIDLAVAQLFRERYGLPCGTGVGLIDAPLPGSLSIFERTFKAFCSSLAGEPSFPVGIIGGAVVFSPEQVLLDLDIAATQAQYLRGIGGEHFEESLGLIRERGIGGLFLDTEHTAHHFRGCLMLPKVFTRLKSTDVGNALAHDPVELAHRRYREILEATPLPTHTTDRSRDIDRVVRDAENALASIRGATE